MAAMEHCETIWIKKEEPDELPNEPGSMVHVHPPTANIKEELEEGENEETFEDPLGILCSPDFISEEPEVILEVDEGRNIVINSTSHETDITRLIKNGEGCGSSFEEPFSQGEQLEKGSEGSAYASTCVTRLQGLTPEEDSEFGTRLKCCSKEKEFHKFSCSSCPQSFTSKHRLTMHVFIHIDGVQPPTFACKSCGEVFPSSDSLNEHIKMSEGDQGLSAGNEPETGCSDDHKNILEGEGFASEETEKQSSCKKARKVSKKSRNDKYNTDTVTHGEVKRDTHDDYETLCTNGDVSDQAVKLAAKPHRCDTCGMSFARRGHLKSHAIKHTGMKPHRCDLCGQTFTQIGSLNRHLSKHAGKKAEKTHKCEVCGKFFTQSQHVKNHMLIHTGIKPHKCDICGRCFTEPASLKRHLLIHYGLTPYKCGACGKSFTQLSCLGRHSLTHTGNYPYKCDICGKAFAQPHLLKRHSFIHSGTSPYKCDKCGKYFTEPRSLKRHALTHNRKKR